MTLININNNLFQMAEILKPYPTLQVPSNSQWVSLAEKKLEQYKESLEKRKKVIHTNHPYWAPEQLELMAGISQRGYCSTILNELLENGEVNTESLLIDTQRMQGNFFNVVEFEIATRIIEYYIKNPTSLADSVLIGKGNINTN